MASSSSQHHHSPSKNKGGENHPSPPLPIHPPAPPLLGAPIRPGQSPLSAVKSEAAFSLYYGHNFKVVQNLFYNFTYLLLQQAEGSFGKDWNLNISVFQDPLMNYTIDTSSAVGFLELLGCAGKLSGVPGSFALASPCVSQLIWQGGIPTIDASSNLTEPNTTTSSAMVFEALFSSSSMQSSDDLNQSNYISFDPLRDRGPLQRAEWIKFIAAFFDLEQAANNVYDQIESNYQCLNASVKGANSTSKPMVAWLSYSTDLGTWTFSDAPYKMQLSLDAGGLNLDPSTLSMSFNMSNELDVNNFHNISYTLDVVFDETYALDPSTYTLENFTTAANITNMIGFPFLTNKRLWRYDKRVGVNNALDWLEGAIAQPQIVLRDLMEALYPTTIDQGYNTTYFRNIVMEESIVNTTTLSCPHDMTSMLQPTIIPCTINSVF